MKKNKKNIEIEFNESKMIFHLILSNNEDFYFQLNKKEIILELKENMKNLKTNEKKLMKYLQNLNSINYITYL